MYTMLHKIQNALLEQKEKKLRNLHYQDLWFYTKPENKPFDYFVLPDFPANDSDQTRRELNAVIAATQNRSVENVLLIDKDPLILYIDALIESNLDFPVEKFNKLYAVLKPIIKELKLYFNRPRPNQIAEFYGINLNVITTKTHHTASYPSGHVAYSYLAELVASEIYPKHKTHLADITQKVGLARMQQGVHFESDNNASIRLVSKIYPQLLELVS